MILEYWSKAVTSAIPSVLLFLSLSCVILCTWCCRIGSDEDDEGEDEAVAYSDISDTAVSHEYGDSNRQGDSDVDATYNELLHRSLEVTENVYNLETSIKGYISKNI